MCCLSVRSSLPDLLLPFGQVGVGVPGGLEAAVHSLRTILSTHSSDSSLCCLKLDMTNAFNECSRTSFLSRCHSDLPELAICLGPVVLLLCWRAPLRASPHSVDNWCSARRPSGSLILFSLVLLDFLSHCHAPDGLCFQLWYLDDGILVGTPSALSSFLDVLQLRGPSYGLHPNLSKCEVFWPSGDQSFADFSPAVKCVVLSQTGGVDFLGSPIWGSPEFFSTFVGSVVDHVSVLQTEHAFEIWRILRSNYFCCVVVWVFVSLTIFYGLYLLAVWTPSYCNLMITFVVPCHPSVTPQFLISLGSRLLCLVPLAAWAYVRLLVLLRQPFWVAVLALLFFVFSFCLPFQEVLFLRLLFQVKS